MGGLELPSEPVLPSVVPPKVVKKRLRPIPPRVEVEGTGTLRAIRAVLANHEKRDRGAEEHAARKWLKAQPRDFLAKRDELEAALVPVSEKAEAKEDAGEERALALVEELLARVRAHQSAQSTVRPGQLK